MGVVRGGVGVGEVEGSMSIILMPIPTSMIEHLEQNVY